MQESRIILHLKRLRKRQEREMEKRRNAILNNSEPEKITYTDYSNTYMYQTESMNIPSFTHESIANMINSVDMPIEKYLDVSGNMDLTKNLEQVSEVKEILEQVSEVKVSEVKEILEQVSEVKEVLEDKVTEVMEKASDVKELLEEKASDVKELLEEKVAQVKDLQEKVSEEVVLIVDSVTTQVESILSSSEQGLVTLRDVGAEALKLSNLKIPDAKCCTIV